MDKDLKRATDTNNTEVSDSDVKITMEVSYVWGLDSEDRQALADNSNEHVVRQVGEDTEQEFYKHIHNVVAADRRRRGKEPPLIWVTK